MQVSFLIPVSAELPRVRALLDSISETLPAGLEHEVLLAGPPTPASENTSDAAPRSSFSHPAALNAVSATARGEFLCFLDERILLQPRWLEPLIAAFSHHRNAGIVACVHLSSDAREVLHGGLVFSDEGLPKRACEPLPSLQARGPFLEFPAVSTRCCLLRRSWFRRRGGFNENLRADVADADLCLRAHEDGLLNLVATESIVHTTLDHTRRSWSDAQAFLHRWSSRAKSLHDDWSLDEARRRAAADATRYFEKLPNRLRLGSPSLYRQHRKALEVARLSQHQNTRPIRIGVDLSRMQPGGANGGVKPFVFSFLAEMGRLRGSAFNFVVFADEALSTELAPVLRFGDHLATCTAGRMTVRRRGLEQPWELLVETFSPDSVARQLALDVLWAPFASSHYRSDSLPCVSLLIDLLHRDLPDALPLEEVNHRHETFCRIVADATYIQTISRHAISRLRAHYDVPASRCFYTYLPVHNRLPEPDATPPLPAGVVQGQFFFYPANFWPHKNHEALLRAYQLYRAANAAGPWSLVLTGAPDARSDQILALRDQLGLRDYVHVMGHLPDSAFASLWATAGALVFPSLHEGFGIPLLEAMRFGVPILSSDAASLTEIGGDACLFADARNIEAFAHALTRMAKDAALRAQLRERGRARLGEFSLPLEAGRLAHFLEAAARRRTP